MRDNIGSLQNENTQVVAITVDSPFALDAWAAKESYEFPLLSDFNKEVSAAYGVLYENLIGFRGISKRSAFVVDKKGTVQYAWITEDASKLPELDPIRPKDETKDGPEILRVTIVVSEQTAHDAIEEMDHQGSA